MSDYLQRGDTQSPGRDISDSVLRRRGDRGGTYFRCSRFFAVGHEWFATVREGSQIGPFSDRSAAELGVAWHLSQRAVESADVAGELDGRSGRSPTSLDILYDELLACRREAAKKSVIAACASARQRLEDIEKSEKSAKRRTHAPLKAKAIRLFLEEIEG